MPRRTQSAEWWQNYFDSQYLLEYEPLFSLDRDRREASRLIDVLGLPSGARILDVPCGQGRHAHLLAEAGFDVDGLDYSRSCSPSRRTRHREAPCATRAETCARCRRVGRGASSAVLNLFTSFGFFTNPADDRRVMPKFARVLEPGGVLLWHGGSRDGVMARFLHRDWWQTHDGTLVAQERTFDPLSGQLTVHSVWSGPRRTAVPASTRFASTRQRASRSFAPRSGLIVEQAFEGFTPSRSTRRSSEMMLVARKTETAATPR